jgi:hypothetical protein
MSVTTKSGRVLSKADLDRLAAKAEAGFEPSSFRPRRGRPFLDADATEHSPRIGVRVPASVRDRARAKAASEGRSISDVVRDLLEEYAQPEPVRRASRR